jgi:Ni,Fe-hydrogenase III large subunit
MIAEGLGSRAPAYRAADGAFALVNDYSSQRSVLLRPEELTEAEARVTEAWKAHPAGPWEVATGERVEGYGTFRFPYGPLAQGVPEAGAFSLITYGERVLEAIPTPGYKPRGILPSLVGLPVADAALRVERMCGPFSSAHLSAFLAAAESATATPLPEREAFVRALAQELQRIYNHLHVLARLAEAASQNIGHAQTHALAEEVLRLSARTFGHRWLFGALLPHGPARHLEEADRRRLSSELVGLGKRFDLLWELFQRSRTFIDRLQTTGAVPAEEARSEGAVGPVLRACGVAWDVRLRDPLPPYQDLFLPLAQASEGDALARLLVRAEEIRGSLLLLEQILDRWPKGPGGEFTPRPPLRPGRGWARGESPSGDLLWEVSVADDRVLSAGFRSASQANWPLFARAMRNAVFTDFHFTLESFGLFFAETDG